MKRFLTRKFLLIALLLVVGAWAAYAETHEVTQKDKHFNTEEITIKVNDSVNFLNRDTVTHNVFVKTPNFSFSIKQAAGVDKAIQFPVAGDYDIRCAIHPTMKLRVHVVP